MKEPNPFREENGVRKTDVHPAGHLPDSAEYLAKLEAKLSHLSGRNKKPVAKEMLSLLQAGKEDCMNHLIQVNNNIVCSSFLPEISCDDKEMSQSYLKRKLFPEKAALSNEELQHLLAADVLSVSSETCNSDGELQISQ